MSGVVSMHVPRDDWRGELDPDGYWRLPIRDRLRSTHARAKAMGLVWLSPYIPQYAKQRVGDRVWRTDARPTGFVRATAARALRLHFEDSASDALACSSVRLLTLASQWRVLDPSVRWADMGELAHWPIAIRVDAQRLMARFERLAVATWCIECDDAPWASTRQRCLWCERLGAPPAPAVARDAHAAAA